MKKNELVHLHTLLGCVAAHLTERDTITEEALASYEAIGVTPMALREPRERHKKAVVTLAATLAAAVSSEDTVDVDPAPLP